MARVPSTNMEETGFMIYTAAGHQYDLAGERFCRKLSIVSFPAVLKVHTRSATQRLAAKESDISNRRRLETKKQSLKKSS